MKWLSLFKRKRDSHSGDESGGPDVAEGDAAANEDTTTKASTKDAAEAPALGARGSLEQWFKARTERTFIGDGNNTTTTDQLTVTKAGVSLLINRQYVVIKHLGSGTYGQVKLAFNLHNRKLYAIKACRKSQIAPPPTPTPALSGRASTLSRSRRTLGTPRRPTTHEQSASGAPPAAPQPAVPEAPAPAAPSQQPAAPAVDEVMNSGTGQTHGASVAEPPSQAPTGVADSKPPMLRTGSHGTPAAEEAPAAGAGEAQQSQLQSQRQSFPGFTMGSYQKRMSGGSVGSQRVGNTRYHYSSSGTGTFSRGSARNSAHRPPSHPASDILGARESHQSSKQGESQPSCEQQGGVSQPTPIQPKLQGEVCQQQGAGTGAATGGPPGAAGVGGQQPQQFKPPDRHQQPQGATATAAERVMRQRAEDFVREVAVMKKLSHPNVVKLVEVIDDPGSDNLLLVMEYVEGESLHPRRIDPTHWERVPEPEVWRRTRDVLQGLDYLHFHGVVHGDLKPANLMLDANTRHVKIVDFGSAMFSATQQGRTMSGLSAVSAMSCTPAFRSPESLAAGYVPSFELDIWALGVTVFMWMFGQLPFNGAVPFLIYECIRRQDMRLPDVDFHVSMELKDFLKAVLEKDPTKRLDVVGALQHPWVTGKGTAPLPILDRAPLAAAMEDEPAVHVDSGCSPETLSGLSTGPSLSNTSSAPATSGGEVCPASPSRRRRRLGQKEANKGAGTRSVRGVSQEEIDRAISESIGGNAISELMGSLFTEITFSPRQQIVSAGDPMDAIYLIAQGEVEIYKELPSQVQPAVFAEHDSSTQGLSNGHTTTAFGMQGVADVQPLVPDFIRKSLTHSSCNQPGAAHPDSILCTCAADLHLHGVPARQSQGGFMLQGAGLPHGVPQLSSIDEHVVKLGSTTGAAGDADMEMEVELPPPAEDSEASAAATIAAGPGPAKQKDDHHHVTFRTPPSVMMTGNSDTAVNGSSRQGSFSVPPLTRKSQHQHHQPLSAAASLAEPIIAGIGHPHALINGSHTEPRDDLEDVDEFLCTSSHIQQHQHGPLLHMPFSGLADAVRTSNNQETGVTSSGSFLHNSSLLGASELTGQHTQGPTSGEIAGHVLILAVKGPGDSLGLASLHPPSSSQGQGQGHPHDDDLSQGEAAEGEGLQLPPLPKPTWQAHVRARGEVLAFKADVDNMNRLLALHPELEAALKNIAGQQETDLMVAEALRQLRLASAGYTPNGVAAGNIQQHPGLAPQAQGQGSDAVMQ